MLFTNIYFVTIWALGVSMIVLALLIFLPIPLVLVIGFCDHRRNNLFDNFHVQGNTRLPSGPLHDQAFFDWKGHNVLVGYPHPGSASLRLDTVLDFVQSGL